MILPERTSDVFNCLCGCSNIPAFSPISSWILLALVQFPILSEPNESFEGGRRGRGRLGEGGDNSRSDFLRFEASLRRDTSNESHSIEAEGQVNWNRPVNASFIS